MPALRSGCEIIVTQRSALLHGPTSTEDRMEGRPSSLIKYKLGGFLNLSGSLPFSFSVTFGDYNNSYTRKQAIHHSDSELKLPGAFKHAILLRGCCLPADRYRGSRYRSPEDYQK